MKQDDLVLSENIDSEQPQLKSQHSMPIYKNQEALSCFDEIQNKDADLTEPFASQSTQYPMSQGPQELLKNDSGATQPSKVLGAYAETMSSASVSKVDIELLENKIMALEKQITNIKHKRNQ